MLDPIRNHFFPATHKHPPTLAGTKSPRLLTVTLCFYLSPHPYTHTYTFSPAFLLPPLHCAIYIFFCSRIQQPKHRKNPSPGESSFTNYHTPLLSYQISDLDSTLRSQFPSPLCVRARFLVPRKSISAATHWCLLSSQPPRGCQRPRRQQHSILRSSFCRVAPSYVHRAPLFLD